jgi:hypothetical protein
MKSKARKKQLTNTIITHVIGTTYWLRSTLQLRKEHQQDTSLLFIDLIKAFDTANHDLLFAILEKYGAPRALIDFIQRLHDNFQLKLVFYKKNQAIIDYTVGV